MSFELLKRLCATPGVPGREDTFRELLIAELQGVAEELRTDAMGNLIAVRRGKGQRPRKIMLAAHMDEIAFVVRSIHKDGFIYFHPLGGFDPRTLVAQRVKVYGKRVLDGVIGIKATHLTTPEERSKVIPLEELFIDVGLPAEEVKELVSIGDPITLERELIEMGNLYTGKTLDDRVGVYVMLEAFRSFSESADDVYAVATVQEEVGVRGAQVASFGLEPEIGIAIDVTIAADTPGMDEHQQCTRLGKGVAIKILDSYSISHPGLVRFLREIAEQEGIPYQLEVLPRGGTDAAAMQRSRAGIPVCTLSIPNRYTHSVVECVHKEDVAAAITLLRRFLERSAEFQW
ncbi:Putative aminopeptidase YsdC [bacterium HR21]|nr:Putative aminopeptidase YsdC [bacterium HR21]